MDLKQYLARNLIASANHQEIRQTRKFYETKKSSTGRSCRLTKNTKLKYVSSVSQVFVKLPLNRLQTYHLHDTMSAVQSTDETQKQQQEETKWTFCSVDDLYNALPFGYLVIDIRDKEKYDQCHVKTSKNISVANQTVDEMKKNVDSILSSKLPGKSNNKIYLCCNLSWNTKESKATLESIFSVVSKNGKQMFVVNDPISQFFEQFPFYCNKKSKQENNSSEKEESNIFLKYPNCIIKNKLYLGTGNQATNETTIKNLGITHIVNVTAHIGMPFAIAINDDESKENKEKEVSINNVKYLNIAIEDHNDNENANKFYLFFDEAIKFIDNALNDKQENGNNDKDKDKDNKNNKNNNNRVMIHCEMGVSRSGTITILYIMHSMKYSLVDAYLYVSNRREIVHPNDSFLQQLIKYEKRLFNGVTTGDSQLLKDKRQKMAESKVTNMHKALGQVFGGAKNGPTGLDLLKMRRDKKKAKGKNKKAKSSQQQAQATQATDKI